MRKRSRYLSLDDAWFVVTLAVPVMFSVAFDVDSLARSTAIVLAHQPREDARVKVVAQVKTEAAQPEARVR